MSRKPEEKTGLRGWKDEYIDHKFIKKMTDEKLTELDK